MVCVLEFENGELFILANLEQIVVFIFVILKIFAVINILLLFNILFISDA